MVQLRLLGRLVVVDEQGQVDRELEEDALDGVECVCVVPGRGDLWVGVVGERVGIGGGGWGRGV